MLPDAQRTLGHRIKSRKLDNIPPFGAHKDKDKNKDKDKDKDKDRDKCC